MKPRAVVLLLALTASVSLAKAEQLPLKIYTTADGLPGDRIHGILSDSHGYLWFATEDGLSRFDGYGFRNFTAADGLAPAPVEALLESRDGTYWVGTNTGLVRLDASRAPVRPGASVSTLHVPGGGLRDEIRALLEGRDGTLWVGTEDGLYRLAPNASAPRLDRVPFGPSVAYNVPVYALMQDRDGKIWIASELGLYAGAPGRTFGRVADRDGAPHSTRSLAQDRRGAVWAGTHREGLFEIANPRDAAPRRAYSVASGLAGEHVTALLETSDGRLWASCYGGVAEIAADRSSIRRYTTSEGLASVGTWSLAEDRDGNLWIGSDSSGVMRLARDGFRRFDERDGLKSLRVGSLFESRDGSVCAFTRGQRPEDIATGDGFLECFDGRRFQTQQLRLPHGTLFGWGWAQVTLQDDTGTWWVPTLSGLFRFPPLAFGKLGAAVPERRFTTRDGLPDDRILRLYADRRGDLWLGLVGDHGNLAAWSRTSGTFRTFRAADGIPEREPMSFAEDRSGALWIGFREGGLVRYAGGAFSSFDGAAGLPAGSIRALLCDRGGRLWIASSREGLARVDRPEEPASRFAILGPAQGLSSANTSSLAEDLSGRIYVGTERGLDRIDPVTGNVQRFTTDDGLPRGVVEASLRDRHGDLWFGSVEGLSRLTPAAEARKPPPPTRIARVLVNGVRQPIAEIGAKSVSLAARTTEPTSVQIDFVALDFAPGGRPRYQYRVDGLDRDWSAPTTQPSVVYARLPSGSYRFRVRGIANGGGPGSPEAVVEFAVRPSFWKRPEVVAALALVLLGIAYALHRNRLKNALAIERVRAGVARDLHDDVGSGLSEIAILSEVAGQRDGRPSPRDPALEEIGNAARRLVDSMSDIVWSTDPRRDDVASLVARVRHFAANTLEGRGIAWSLEVPPEFEIKSLDPDRRRQIFLILKEALTNVARHSRCRRASIRILPGPRDVTLEIEDDGVGFAPHSAAGTGDGHGLLNMKARALAAGGQFRLDASPSGGTRIQVRIPLRRAFGARSA